MTAIETKDNSVAAMGIFDASDKLNTKKTRSPTIQKPLLSAVLEITK
jgi:hypothetical protein